MKLPQLFMGDCDAIFYHMNAFNAISVRRFKKKSDHKLYSADCCCLKLIYSFII